MKTKIFTSILVAAILTAAFVLALSNIAVSPTTLDFTKAVNNRTFAITNNNNQNVTIAITPTNPQSLREVILYPLHLIRQP